MSGGSADELDHLLAINVARALCPAALRRAFTLENLPWLCSECHGRKTSLDRTLSRFLLACSLDWRRVLNVLRANRAELLFEVFSQRYERGSIVLTTNLPFDEWTEMFGSETLSTARHWTRNRRSAREFGAARISAPNLVGSPGIPAAAWVWARNHAASGTDPWAFGISERRSAGLSWAVSGPRFRGGQPPRVIVSERSEVDKFKDRPQLWGGPGSGTKCSKMSYGTCG